MSWPCSLEKRTSGLAGKGLGRCVCKAEGSRLSLVHSGGREWHQGGGVGDAHGAPSGTSSNWRQKRKWTAKLASSSVKDAWCVGGGTGKMDNLTRGLALGTHTHNRSSSKQEGLFMSKAHIRSKLALWQHQNNRILTNAFMLFMAIKRGCLQDKESKQMATSIPETRILATVSFRMTGYLQFKHS